VIDPFAFANALLVTTFNQNKGVTPLDSSTPIQVPAKLVLYTALRGYTLLSLLVGLWMPANVIFGK
jgi:hypothetical protein